MLRLGKGILLLGGEELVLVVPTSLALIFYELFYDTGVTYDQAEFLLQQI